MSFGSFIGLPLGVLKSSSENFFFIISASNLEPSFTNKFCSLFITLLKSFFPISIVSFGGAFPNKFSSLFVTFLILLGSKSLKIEFKDLFVTGDNFKVFEFFKLSILVFKIFFSIWEILLISSKFKTISSIGLFN